MCIQPETVTNSSFYLPIRLSAQKPLSTISIETFYKIYIYPTTDVAMIDYTFYCLVC